MCQYSRALHTSKLWQDLPVTTKVFDSVNLDLVCHPPRLFTDRDLCQHKHLCGCLLRYYLTLIPNLITLIPNLRYTERYHHTFPKRKAEYPLTERYYLTFQYYISVR